MWFFQRCWAKLVALIVIGALSGPMSAWGDSSNAGLLANMQQDATLHDVCFPTPQYGWAVGDRGVIWATANGGQTWRQQLSPVTCPLRSVHFVDAQTGWAVGGWVHPYTHRTTGVVLRTRDGGRRWIPTPGLSLPALSRVKFFDAQHGWAIGASSPLFPSGLFRTDDAGRSWRTVPSGRSESLLTGDFIDQNTGAVAGRNGELLVVRGAKVRDSQTADVGRRALHCLRLSDTNGWLAGADGLLMNTHDGGQTWRRASPPELQSEQFDFYHAAMHGDDTWIVGSPGSIVFHTRDQGRSWRALRTGQSLGLRAVTFVNSRVGWAVGELGLIMATSDGGQSWQEQRAGGKRVAMLGLFSQPDNIPWELLARYSGEEGYLTAIHVLGRRDGENTDQGRAGLDSRLQAGVLGCGASESQLSNEFPLRQAGIDLNQEQLLQLWRQINDGDPMQVLESTLVQRIRKWRPEVIVATQGDSPLDRLLAQITMTAADQAADPTAHSIQLTAGGLQPWQAKKVLLIQPSQDQRSVQSSQLLVPSQLAARWGASVGEVASHGRAMMGKSPQRSQAYQIKVARSEIPRQGPVRDLFHGLTLRAGGEARRELSPPAVPLDVLTRRAQLTRNTEAFVDQTLKNGLGNRWVAGLSELTTELPAEGASALLFELAESFRRQGRMDLSIDVLERLVQEHSEQDIAEAAMLQLIRYYTSSEDAWRRQSKTLFTTQTAVAERVLRQAPRASDIPSILDPRAPAIGTANTVMTNATTAGGQDLPSHRRARAMELAEVIQRTNPNLHADPELRFALASAERFEGTRRDTGKFFQSLNSRAHQNNPWALRAGFELWLGGGLQGQPPIPVTHCDQGPPPYLDGRLNDTIWKDAAPLRLQTPHYDDGDWPATAVLAWDANYLYVGASCRSIQTTEPTSGIPGRAPSKRQRDADQASQDRITLRLDRDRDYASAFEFTIDRRGWGGERCLGDPTWDPQWHIAVDQNNQQWTVEAAIPWKALGPRAPKSGDAWAIDIHRVVPQRGVQSWTKASTIESNVEGFGAVVFRR